MALHDAWRPALGQAAGSALFQFVGKVQHGRQALPENIPEEVKACSFWIDAAVCDKMLSGRDSYAYAGYSGFQASKMPNWTGVAL